MKKSLLNIISSKNICILLFLTSIIFYLRIFRTLTWFEVPLDFFAYFKRIILGSMLSIGFLTLNEVMQKKLPMISKLLLGISFLLLSICSLLYGPIILFLFVTYYSILIYLFFNSRKRNAIT